MKWDLITPAKSKISENHRNRNKLTTCTQSTTIKVDSLEHTEKESIEAR